MTPPRVWALPPRATSGYRRAWARERLRDSFWPVPALLLAAGVILAAVTVNARSLGIPAVLRAGPRVDPGETSSVLGIIASSTLTFLGVVFTLSLDGSAVHGSAVNGSAVNGSAVNGSAVNAAPSTTAPSTTAPSWPGSIGADSNPVPGSVVRAASAGRHREPGAVLGG